MTIQPSTQEAPSRAGPPQRDTEDVLAGILRLTLARREYILPVLTIGENADWQATLTAEVQPLLDDALTMEQALQVMAGLSDKLLAFLRSYDKTGVLPPPGDWERDIYPYELMSAVLAVRLVADPTLSYAVAAFAQEQTALRRAMTPAPAPSEPTSGSRRRTAGRRAKSGRK